jgi:DNA topoisomerase-1
VTLEQAVELLAQPKTRGGRTRGAPREPLKTFEASPITKQPVKLLDGRYGPYVTDGDTNASLPKGMAAEELTIERALDLLAERAAMGGSKKKKPKRAKGTRAAKKAAPAEATEKPAKKSKKQPAKSAKKAKKTS